jgi:streptogramin lyase
MIRFQLFAAALGLCALSACAGASSPLTVDPPNQIAHESSLSTVQTLDVASNSPLRADTRLYVSNWEWMISFPPASPSPVANAISVFDIAHHDAPLTPIPVGNFLSPSYITFDRFGKLYVSDASARSITVFDTLHGNTELPSITAGLTSPQGIAVDARGRLFVANGTQISVFDTQHGNAALPAIVAVNFNPGALALDSSGKLYVPNGGDTVMVFDTKRGNAPLHTITGNGLTLTEGITVAAGGRLYVDSAEGLISVFDTLHANAPLPPISGNGLAGPAGMVVDARGRLYVANFQYGPGNSILVFDTTTKRNTFIGTITGGGLMGAYSLALQ